MKNTSSEETGKRSFEQIPKLVPPDPTPSPEAEITAAWDKNHPPPAAPPGVVRRDLPEWADGILLFLSGVIADEALVLDLCYEKACEIVDWNFSKGVVGIDSFQEGQGGAGPRALVCGIAGPLAVELYKQALAALNGPQKQALKDACDSAEREKKLLEEKARAPQIITP